MPFRMGISPLEETAMNVTSVIVNVNSEDPARLTAFYRDLIGLTPNPNMGETALDAGNLTIVFDTHSEVTGKAVEPPRNLLNFMVADLVAEQARLEAGGVRFITSGGTPQGEEIAFSTFVDPDGNYGQIFQGAAFPPGMKICVLARHTADLAPMRPFYRDVVGLSDDFPHLGNPFMAGPCSIYLPTHDDVRGPAKEPARILLNFFVEDLAAEQKRIEAKGVTFLRSAGREYWGGVISTFADPDGNLLQLIEFKPE